MQSFLGTGWAFPIRFQMQDGSVVMASDEEDIRQSLWLLLSTQPGERQTRPRYGCPLQDFVHAPVNSATQALMREAINRAILEFEPRVELEDIEFAHNQALDGQLDIKVHYLVRSTNTRSNIVYPFYQLEGTNVQEV